jgi:UDP-2-acetamido-3-amino-2,3-dideoxy-glucuronate N-acetyltransferase
VSQFRDDAQFPGVRIHVSSYIDHPIKIGEGTTIWHFCHLLGGVSIGRNCSLGQNVMVGPNVTIGDGCRIQNNVSIFEGVTIEDFVFCGPSCVFTNVKIPRAEIKRAEFQKTLIRTGATIGANATLVCGNIVGRYALVGAGAVVTKDVPDFALISGVPARHVGWVSRVGHRLDESLVCPETGERYVLKASGGLESVSGQNRVI